ncbi:MAG TPA: NAD-glutamate dehydrogenase, partial [Caulobacteraceae bacterium]
MMQKTAPAGDFSLENLEKALDSALGAPASPAQGAFVAAVLEDFRPGELDGVTPADLAEVLAGFWKFAKSHHGQAPTVRLIRARGAGERDLMLDLLEIVQPDAPFLVDSVMGEVSESGAEVRAMFHPMVEEGRAETSMIQVWLAPVGEERRAGLIERVLAAMADVHAAVTDFPAMLKLLGECIAGLERDAPKLRHGAEAIAEDLAFLR